MIMCRSSYLKLRTNSLPNNDIYLYTKAILFEYYAYIPLTMIRDSYILFELKKNH